MFSATVILSLTIWQYFAVVPDFRATGVREGKRAYDWPCIIRCINTVDVMTAEVPELDWALLKRITARIYRRGPRHLSRLLRPHAQTRRHGGMGVIAHIIVRFNFGDFAGVLVAQHVLRLPTSHPKR